MSPIRSSLSGFAFLRALAIKILDTFTRTVSGALGVSDSGHTWTTLRGTWYANGSAAQSDTAASSYPLAAINIGAQNTTTSASVTNGCGPAFWITDANSWWASTVYSNTSTYSCNCSCYNCSGGTYPNCSCGSYSITDYGCYSCSGGSYPNCSCGSYPSTTSVCKSCPNLDCGYETCPSCYYCGSSTKTCTWYCNGDDGSVVTDSCGLSRTCGKAPGYFSGTATVCNSCANYDCGLATCASCANCGSDIVTNYYCYDCSGGSYPNCSCGSYSSVSNYCNSCSGGTYPNCSCGSSCQTCTAYNYYLRILSAVGGTVSTATGDVSLTSAAASIVVQTSGNTITSKAYDSGSTLVGTSTYTPASPTRGTQVGIVKAPTNYNQGSTVDNFSSTI